MLFDPDRTIVLRVSQCFSAGNQRFPGQELTEARAARCSSTHLGELARLMRGDSVKLGKLEDSMEVGLGVLTGK